MSYVLLTFPVLIALLVAAANLVALLLWLDPSSPTLWMLSLWCRELTGDYRLLGEMITGIPDIAMALCFAVTAMIAYFASERVRVWSGALLSHFSTLLLLLAPVIFHSTQTSANQSLPFEMAPMTFSGFTQLDYGSLAWLGIAMCVLSHITFIRMTTRSGSRRDLLIRDRCGCI